MNDELNGTEGSQKSEAIEMPGPVEEAVTEAEPSTAEAAPEAEEAAAEVVSEAEEATVEAEEATAEPAAEVARPMQNQASQPYDYSNRNQTDQAQGGPAFYHYAYHKGAQDQKDQGVNPGQEHRTEPQKKSGGMGKKFGICVALALVFGLVASVTFQAGNAIGGRVFPGSTGSTEQSEKATLQRSTEGTADAAESEQSQAGTSQKSGSMDVAAVARTTMPSIVAITNKGVQEVQNMFFGTTQKEEVESSGSGFIIAKNDTELLIATNNHVVADAQTLSVCFTVEIENSEDAVVSAQVKGTDSEHDLAVIAVSLSDISDDVLKNIKIANLGDSDKLEVGEQVIAIGNALGYGQSVTVGYVSALNREITIDGYTSQMIQTDAAINFGNSGGALMDTEGNVIGINSAKAADTGVEGMGYAIPVNTASPILDELMNRTTRSKVTDGAHGYLGLYPADVSEEARQIYNLPSGAFVYSVVEGGPAEKAGIKKGDVITKLDGVTITSKSELLSRMEYYKVGESIDVVVKTAEGGEYIERTVTVVLGEKPADSQDTQKTPDTEQQEVPYEAQPDNGYYFGDGSQSLEDFFNQFN